MLRIMYKKPILPFTFTWVALGFKRGLDYYDHSEPSVYLYKNRLIMGFFGGIIYVNPIMLLFTINKELYRLEVLVRDIEDERNKTSYYDLY